MKTFKVIKQIQNPHPITLEENIIGDYYEVTEGILSIFQDIPGKKDEQEAIASFNALNWVQIKEEK